MKVLSAIAATALVALPALPTDAGSGMGMEITGQLYKKPMEANVKEGEPTREIAGSEAILLTTPKGVFASVETGELTPGNVYTLWFVAINNPAACENHPCKASDVLGMADKTKSDVGYGDGVVAGDSGTATLVTHRPMGALPQAWIGTGLARPDSAEIHLVIHDHGPLIAGREAAMTGTFRDGCTEESLSEMVPDTARADGAPGPNACKIIQHAIFEQAEKQAQN